MQLKIDPGDLEAVLERDPAIIDDKDAVNYHAGFRAICMYRMSHELWLNGQKDEARKLNYEAHKETGCDIHPGATIGKRFFIDHATGVVVGETSIVGDDVTLYQGVTLGGVSFKKGEKRHPTIGNRVVIGCNATVLGDITIGDDVRIGAGSVVLKDVPHNCTVVGVPGKIVKMNGVSIDGSEILNHNDLPDYTENRLQELEAEILQLRKVIKAVKKETEEFEKKS